MNFTLNTKTTRSLMTESMKQCAILFIGIALTGFTLSLFLRYFTNIGENISHMNRFSGYAISNVRHLGGVTKSIGIFQIFAIILSIASAALSIYFHFNFHLMFQRITKRMVRIILGTYVASNGVSFGMLFFSFNAYELMLIFAVASFIMFLIWGLSKFVKVDAARKWYFPIVLIGSIAVTVVSAVSVILYITGVFRSKFIMISMIVSSIVTVFWIMLDFLYISMNESMWDYDSADEVSKYVYPRYMGFRLASDMVSLVWRLASWLAYSSWR